MQPLGNKILVRDVINEEAEVEVLASVGSNTANVAAKGKTAGGIFIPVQVSEHYRKVRVEAVSPDSVLNCFNEKGEKVPVSVGDICLCNPGGLELETGLWLCNDSLLDCKL